jgi:hypothetical protein
MYKTAVPRFSLSRNRMQRYLSPVKGARSIASAYCRLSVTRIESMPKPRRSLRIVCSILVTYSLKEKCS